MPMKDRRNIFLSYSQKDADEVHSILSRVPQRGFAFWDARRIFPGSNWALEVGKALEEADGMLIFFSPNYFSSQWSQRELEYVISSPRFEGRLISVLLKRTPQVPWILERFQFIDATEKPALASKQIAKALQVAEVSKR